MKVDLSVEAELEFSNAVDALRALTALLGMSNECDMSMVRPGEMYSLLMLVLSALKRVEDEMRPTAE